MRIYSIIAGLSDVWQIIHSVHFRHGARNIPEGHVSIAMALKIT
jgi:hypothetical protein